MPVPGQVGVPILQKLMELYDEYVPGGTKTQIDNLMNSMNAIPPVAAPIGMAGLVLRPKNIPKIMEEAKFLESVGPDTSEPLRKLVAFLGAKYPRLANRTDLIREATEWGAPDPNFNTPLSLVKDAVAELGGSKRNAATAYKAYKKYVRMVDDDLLRRQGIMVPMGELENPTKARNPLEVLGK